MHEAAAHAAVVQRAHERTFREKIGKVAPPHEQRRGVELAIRVVAEIEPETSLAQYQPGGCQVAGDGAGVAVPRVGAELTTGTAKAQSKFSAAVCQGL